MHKRFFILTLVVAGALVLLPVCKKPEDGSSVKTKIKASFQVSGDKGRGGIMVFELDPAKSPKGVERFVTLAKQGMYDGLLMFHVSKEGLIQSGCPFNDGSGAAPDNKVIKAELDTTLKTMHGMLVMRAHFENDPAMISSQILLFKNPVLTEDGKNCFIGMLVQGGPVLDSIHKDDTIISVKITEDTVKMP